MERSRCDRVYLDGRYFYCGTPRSGPPGNLRSRLTNRSRPTNLGRGQLNGTTPTRI